MTNKEKEICDASLLYLKDRHNPKDNPLDICGHFIAGANWANKTMLDKACQWLEEHIFDFPWFDPEEELSGVTIANIFRKAMEE